MQYFYSEANVLEAGIDEVGRGCLAGPVVAAAVILPRNCNIEGLGDSKKINSKERLRLKNVIEKCALAWAIAEVSPQRIDEINILNATYEAMHVAIDQLKLTPALLLVDGNRFAAYPAIAHHCIVKGDAKFASIAAASILAKVYRDTLMQKLATDFPAYGWATNVGYPTKVHKLALTKYGDTSHHRKSFKWKPPAD